LRFRESGRTKQKQDGIHTATVIRFMCDSMLDAEKRAVFLAALATYMAPRRRRRRISRST
jgi:hypothetical protein